jgi:uncharacterized delta-60 repeat protein
MELLRRDASGRRTPLAAVSCVRRLTASLGLALLGIATAWAGRGDIDPNYGEGGRLAIGPAVLVALLALPDDRLVVAEGTGEDFRVRMVDAAGQNVPAFGDGGVALIDSSVAVRTFLPEAAALASNGDIIFLGALSDTLARAVLRLDNDGQPVLSFGNGGDGLVEPALTAGRATSFAIDPDGKIVLAEGIWSSDASCGTAARLQRLLANGQPDTGYGGDGIIEIPNLDVCNGAPVFVARDDGGVIVGDGHTIVAVDAAGDIDPTFGADGRLTVTELDSARAVLLPDGGLLIFGSNDESASSNDTVILKFGRNGRPDPDFGAGTGSVTVDLGDELLGAPSSREYVHQLALDPDGEHVVAQLSFLYPNENPACGGIARLTIDGTPDTGFGRNGLTCLNFNFNFTAVQSDGAPLFFEGYNAAIHRLLPDNSPSPGILTVATPSFEVGESAGAATVAIARVAGHEGAVSVNYTTAYRPPFNRDPYRIDSAAAGSDYTATSGRLDWASGDVSERTVAVSILNDDIFEYRERFGVDFSEAGGGVQFIAPRSYINIADDDTATTPPPPTPPPPPPASGGGGSVSWATQLALLTLLFIRRRQIQRATTVLSTNHCAERASASRSARIAFLPSVLLLVSAAAWAGRADVDPNYGEGGRVSAPNGAVLALPGDRLVILEVTGEGLRVRMVDATGRSVATFGEGGAVSITTVGFWPEAGALASNGDMIFAGPLSDAGARGLLRLDKNGRPVASFGDHGDGIVELALTTTLAMAFAVDPDGKIFVAEGGAADTLGNCGTTARLQRLLANGQPDAAFGDDALIEIPNLELCQGPAVFGARADGSVIIGNGQTIVAVDAAGDIDPAFGVDGRMDVADFDWKSVLLLPDDSLLIVGSKDASAPPYDTTFMKFDRNGQPDPNFGEGTGSVTVDLGTELLGEPSAHEYVGQLALDPDGEHVAANVNLSVSSGNGYGRLLCSGIARLSIDGTLDAGFGRNGVTCLNVNFALIAVQSNGAPLFLAGYWSDSILRLLPDNSPSPGFLAVATPNSERGSVREDEGTATVILERVAGDDGAVSASFATFPLRMRYRCGYEYCATDAATADSDYMATSGRLDWAHGEDGQRTISIGILDDGVGEDSETFGVAFSEPGGGVLLLTENPTFAIVDNDAGRAPPPTTPPTPEATPSPASGGGGSVSWTTQLALLTLLLIPHRRVRRVY